MPDKNNVFVKMANYLYKEDALKEAYLRGCANGICLMQNLMNTTVTMNDLISPEDQKRDIKAMNVMIHNNKVLTEEDIIMLKTLDMPITACNFSPRTSNGLIKHDIKTVKDLLEKIPDGNLSQIRGFGRKCISEIMDFFDEHHLYFGMMEEPIVFEKYAIFKWK